jgi:predicted amidohydrolase YtcJ
MDNTAHGRFERNNNRRLPLLAAMCSMACATHAATSAPEAIFFHGKIITLAPGRGVQQAFAVHGEHFVAVGTDPHVCALAAKHTRLIDLAGATVIPGLSDNHDHLWNAGKYLVRGVDMVGVTSRPELVERLRGAVAKAKPGEVVYTTTGWNLQPAPTRRELDEISPEIPIVLIGFRRGSGVFNTAALRRLGVSRTNPTFMGANVPVDEVGEPLGTPAGYPVGVYMIDALLPPLMPPQQDALVAQGMAERNALGITSIRELAIWPDAVKALERIRREGKLTVRIALGLEFPDQAETVRHLSELPPVKRDDLWLFPDSLSEEPWTPGSIPLEDFTRLAKQLSRLGWRPAPHVSADPGRGIEADEATERTLDAYEAVNRETPLDGKRWYLEHVPFATPAQMDRMTKLGLIVSTQDGGYRPMAHPSLPPERMQHENPIRGLLDRQLVVIGGSDYVGPNAIEKHPNNPMIPFYFYVTRKTQSGASLAPDEKISREEALRVFTANAAYATFQEKIKGRIAPGMLADFVVLNQDLMTVPDEQILATRPVATYVGGKKVFSAANARTGSASAQ